MATRPVTTPVPTRAVPGFQTPNVRPASATTSGRPYSASNLPTSVANARFKSFQVQYDVLCRNPILAAIAQEIPWKNLFDLFLLKFFAVGDELWAQGEQPHELAFVLCGGFLARTLEEIVQTTTDIFETEKPKTRILAERMIKPGGSLAAYSVLKGTPLPYAVVTARFKSILLSLPSQRLKSVMRQLKPDTRELVEQLIYENEQKLMESLALPFRVRRYIRVSTAPAQTTNKRQTYTTGRPMKRIPASLVDRIMSSSENRDKGSIKRSASTSAVADGTPSWASLQVAKPVEYEVNSSLLILHQSSSTGKLDLPSSTTSKKSALLRSSNLSTVVSRIAKKHTQRRLDSIKLPTQAEAFPPRRLMDQQKLLEKEGGGSFEAVEQLLGKQLAKRVIADVVPKERVGRLLKPLKKPAIIPNTFVNNEERKGRSRGRRVLVSNRNEYFRDASYGIFTDRE